MRGNPTYDKTKKYRNLHISSQPVRERVQDVNSQYNFSSPIFIGGTGRSGTTMLQCILGRHKTDICPPDRGLCGRRFRR
jgi:hypothetical protein